MIATRLRRVRGSLRCGARRRCGNVSRRGGRVGSGNARGWRSCKGLRHAEPTCKLEDAVGLDEVSMKLDLAAQPPIDSIHCEGITQEEPPGSKLQSKEDGDLPSGIGKVSSRFLGQPRRGIRR